MAPAMKTPRDSLLATRRSLVERLGNLDDQASWRAFLDAYGGLLYRVACSAGLTDAEAQEAVQETVITVARNIGGLHYDPAAGSFKGWLLQTARWRIADQFRRRARRDRLEASPPPLDADPGSDGGGPRTAAIDRLPDPAGFNLEAVWESEWRENLLSAALDRVRSEAPPRQFQIFDCYVTRGWTAMRVARELGVNLAQVYLAKHRVGALLKKAVADLERGARLP
jgi:RNA polymerase sigma factor (sigma-70 family)